MAGILKVDQVQSDSNLAFNIAGSNVAFMNATSLQMVGSNVSLAGTNVITSGRVVSSAQPVGAVLQVVSTTKTDNFSTTSGTLVDITGLSATITPTSASSKILVMVAIQVGGNNNYYAEFSLLRGSTAIGNYTGDGSGTVGFMGANSVQDYSQYYIETAANQYLDSPATTSATTYKMQVQSLNQSAGENTIYINRTFDAGNAIRATGSSVITLMEIAA